MCPLKTKDSAGCDSGVSCDGALWSWKVNAAGSSDGHLKECRGSGPSLDQRSYHESVSFTADHGLRTSGTRTFHYIFEIEVLPLQDQDLIMGILSAGEEHVAPNAEFRCLVRVGFSLGDTNIEDQLNCAIRIWTLIRHYHTCKKSRLTCAIQSVSETIHSPESDWLVC